MVTRRAFFPRLARPVVILLLVVELLLLRALSAAAQLPPALTAALQHRLDSTQRAYGVRGVTAAVRFADGTIWTGAAGSSTVQPPDPLRPQMLFGIASITKTFTAALVLRLAERGAFGLDDPIRQHLPVLGAYPNIHPGITIRQLLGHTSGLAEYTRTSAFQDTVLRRPAQRFLADSLLRLVGAGTNLPGVAYAYINTGYLVLGMLIERKLGMPLAQAYRQELLTPTGLDSTFLGYDDPLPAALPVAHSWTWAISGTIRDLSLAPRTALFSGYQAAGGLLATPADVARWGAALFGGSVLSAASRQLMQTASPLSSAARYGLGAIAYSVDGGRTAWGHMGGIWGCQSIFCYEPICGLSIAVLINDDLRPDLRYNLMPALYAIAARATCSVQAVPPPVVVAEKSRFLPNPAHGTTTLELGAPARGHAHTLTLYDAAGRAVRTFALPADAFRHNLPLDGLPPGVYSTRLVSDTSPATVTQRLVVLP